MPIQFIEFLMEELDKKLGNRSFYTLRELMSTGIFGSIQGAKALLRSGRLPHIKISPRRCVISREHVIQFIKDNLCDNSVNLDNFLEEPANNDK